MQQILSLVLWLDRKWRLGFHCGDDCSNSFVRNQAPGFGLRFWIRFQRYDPDCTGLEWRHLIQDEGLTISTNLFGTTFYSLVGLHGFHVLVGLMLMALTAGYAARGLLSRQSAPKVEVLSLYWHFVDAVWVVVFTVVYLVGR